METQELIRKYNNLLRKQRDSEARLIELRTKYTVAKNDLETLVNQLKKEFQVETVEDAEELLEQLKIELEMDLVTLDENIKKLDDI